uniref:Uncharacterized protein n=1 Tax=Anguilla anguilla TaxID=7936 RepID=A0A0E9T257_ANGAN
MQQANRPTGVPHGLLDEVNLRLPLVAVTHHLRLLLSVSLVLLRERKKQHDCKRRVKAPRTMLPLPAP